MPVIFKEKKFDRLLILLNNLALLLLSLLILLTVFNLINENRLESLYNELKLLQGEELKYRSFMEASTAVKPLNRNNYNKYSLLISLADYADQITYRSLHFKNNKLSLKAVSERQHNIFSLIDDLEADKKFKDVDLININQKGNFNFELEILIGQ